MAKKSEKDKKPTIFGNIKRISDFLLAGEREKVVKVVEESILAEIALKEAKLLTNSSFKWKLSQLLYKISRIHSCLDWLAIISIKMMSEVK